MSSDSESFLEKYTRKYGVLKTLEDYEKTPENLVFRTLSKNLSGSATLLEGFNSWCENGGFENQIISKSFTAPDGTIIKFKNPKLGKPMIIKNGKEEILYPHYCRENSIPYTGIITSDCEVTKKNGEKIVTSLELGRLPVMIGSVKCNLYEKTEEELVELNECISDPFGYFILKSERSIVTQDKARMKVPLIYVEKNGKLECKFLSGKIGKTKFFKLTSGKKWFTMKVNDNYERKNTEDIKHLPIFIIFKLLENLDPNEAIEKYIIKFVPKKHQKRVVNTLGTSIIKMKNIKDIVEYLCNKRKKKFSYQKKEELFKEFRDSMIERFFPDLTKDSEDLSIYLKLNTFGYFIARFSLTVIGVLKTDSRDSWINKRFDAAGVSIEILLTSCLNSVIQICLRDISKFSSNPDYSIFGSSLRSKASSYLTRDFNRSFNTDSWGASVYGKTKKQYTETTKRDTPIALWSQTAKTNNSISRRAKSFEIREVHPSQRDKHCLSESPEAITVGMIKFSAITNRYSLETDENIPIEFIKDFFGNKGDIIKGETCDFVIIVNGNFISYKEKKIDLCYTNLKAFDYLKKGKVTGKISLDTEICKDKIMKCIEIYTDYSRATSPYFVINQKTKKLVIEEIDGWDLDYQNLIKSGAIEFLSSKECDQEDTLICYSFNKFKEVREEGEKLKGEEKEIFYYTRNYSHCNVDSTQLLGVTAGCCPLSNRQSGPRNTFQSAMIKQALGYFNINYHSKFYGKNEGFKRLFRGTRCFCETDAYFLPKLDIMPSGQTANVAFLTDPDNQEDSVVISEDFINSGSLNYVKYLSIYYNQQSFGVGIREFIEKPNLSSIKDAEKYINIGDDGLPKLDSYIKEGDCIIGKILKAKDGKVINNSLYTTLGQKGYVERIIKTREKENGNLLIKIKLRQSRKYGPGDKLAIRYAQKGTIGRIESRENMIRVSDGPNKGITPDVIFNPHGFPSRQTCGLLIEGIMTKAALYDGKRVDFTAFRNVDIDGAREVLEKNGFDKDGYENMEFPDGTPIREKIYFVPLYEQVLRHQVIDKIQMRSNGKKSLYTHQPRGGKSQGGGQKIGEMEKDAFVSHGAAGVLVERMMKVSDEFKLVVCQTCGSMINNRVCTVCDNSKPGILTIPYVFKLMINLLNGVGIDIKINTEIEKVSDD